MGGEYKYSKWTNEWWPFFHVLTNVGSLTAESLNACVLSNIRQILSRDIKCEDRKMIKAFVRICVNYYLDFRSQLIANVLLIFDCVLLRSFRLWPFKIKNLKLVKEREGKWVSCHGKFCCTQFFSGSSPRIKIKINPSLTFCHFSFRAHSTCWSLLSYYFPPWSAFY